MGCKLAGTIIADYIRTDANQLSLNVGNTTFATINASGFFSNTGTQLIAANGKVSGASVIASSIPTAAIADGAITRAKMGYAGAALQVVSAIKTDTFSFSVTARTWTSVTGLSASITPSSTSNKVLVTAVVSISATNTYNAMGGRVTRNGSAVAVGDTSSSRQSAFFGSDDWYAAASNQAQIYISFLDSPSTTSAVTYQLQLINDRDTETIYVNRGQSDGDSSQTFRNASTITVMEIAG